MKVAGLISLTHGIFSEFLRCNTKLKRTFKASYNMFLMYFKFVKDKWY